MPQSLRVGDCPGSGRWIGVDAVELIPLDEAEAPHCSLRLRLVARREEDRRRSAMV